MLSDDREPPCIERCRREIAAIEAEIRAGNPDLPGLCLALSDWSGELRLIEEELKHRAKKPAAVETGRAEGNQCSDQAFSE